jgi:aromatic-L-amino-acid decarboxylase
VVCFRWHPGAKRAPQPHGDAPTDRAHDDQALDDRALDRANERLLAAVNDTGRVFLSHTAVRGVVALRLAIGHIDTDETHVRAAWDLLQSHAGR